jgi:hypothetical protein
MSRTLLFYRTLKRPGACVNDGMESNGGKLALLLKRAGEIKAKIDAEQAKLKSRDERMERRLRAIIATAILAEAEENKEVKTLVINILKRRVTGKEAEFLQEQGYGENEAVNVKGISELDGPLSVPRKTNNGSSH